MIEPGTTAPSFSLPGTGGEETETHALDEYLDREWTVVLVFYPFDFHPTCTSRLCTVRDADWLTLLDDAAVLGISTDSAHSHGAFARRHGIDFPLLSDSDGRVAEAYGVLEEELDGHRRVAGNALVVVGPTGEVRYAWRGEGPEDELDTEAIRRAVEGDASTAED